MIETTQLIERVTRNEQQLNEMVRWQESQNGQLKEINKKVDKIFHWLLALLTMIIMQLLLTLVRHWSGA